MCPIADQNTCKCIVVLCNTIGCMSFLGVFSLNVGRSYAVLQHIKYIIMCIYVERNGQGTFGLTIMTIQ